MSPNTTPDNIIHLNGENAPPVPLPTPSPDSDLSAIYVLRVECEEGKLPPTNKVFVVANADTTETLNVIRRLISTPPPRTKLVSFAIFPQGFSPEEVRGTAASIFNSSLAQPPNDNQVQETSQKEGTADQTAPCDEGVGSEHDSPSSVGDVDPSGQPADPQPRG